MSYLRGAEAEQYGAQGRTASWHLPSLGHPATSVCLACLFSCSLTANIHNRLEEGGQNTQPLWGKRVMRHRLLWQVPRPVWVWKVTGALWKTCPTNVARPGNGRSEKTGLLLCPALGRLHLALGFMGLNWVCSDKAAARASSPAPTPQAQAVSLHPHTLRKPLCSTDSQA